MTDFNNQEYINFAESINKVGCTIPAFLIFQGKYILYKWTLHNSFSDKTSLSTSNSGYLNNNLAMDWLRLFEKYSVKWQMRLYYLLIIDGYGSHLTYEF